MRGRTHSVEGLCKHTLGRALVDAQVFVFDGPADITDQLLDQAGSQPALETI